jgi:hypothetical protein
MKKETIKTLSTILILLAICYYGMYRNHKVSSYKSQLWVQRLWMDYDKHDDYIREIENRYTYYDFFFSFKPMKSKYWFTQEEIDKYRLELVDEACK